MAATGPQSHRLTTGGFTRGCILPSSERAVQRFFEASSFRISRQPSRHPTARPSRGARLRRPCRSRERILDRRETSLTSVGHSTPFGIDVKMAPMLRPQQRSRLPATSPSARHPALFASPRFLADLRQPPSFVPVEADLPAFCCSFSARASAGRPGETPASAPSRPRLELTRAGVLPALTRAAFSSALMASHWTLTSPVVSPPLSPNTWGWRRISFSVIACTTSPTRPRCSSAMRR